MSNMLYSSADTGSSETGVNLTAHATGNPIGVGGSVDVSAGHSWVIVVGALGILWLLGGVAFKGVRM